MASFTRNWDEANPTDKTMAYDIDEYNRYLRVDCSDRLKNMIYGFIAGENTLAQHFQYLEFYEQSSAPATPAAGFGRIYCKAVAGKCELFWKDEDGDEIQLTTGGKWNGAVLLAGSVPAGSYAADSIDEDDIQLANNAYLTAKDAAGTGTVNLIKAGANDLPTLPDSAEMASNAAPVEDEAIANKKYIDDLIAAEVTARSFGTWTDKDSGGSDPLAKDEIYKAGSDGFVVSYNTTTANVYIYTDGSSSPATARWFSGYTAFCPVRKNDYWKVACTGSPTIYWLPIGSGTCVKQA